MNKEEMPVSGDDSKIGELIGRLAEAEAALSVLMQGQADAYINPATAAPKLLSEAQTWLLMSQQRLKQIHDAIACGVIVRNSDGVIVHANAAVSRMLGIPSHQMIGRKHPAVPVRTVREDGSQFSTDEYPGVIALQTGRPVDDVIMGVLGKDGQPVIWILVNAHPVADPEIGHVAEVVITLMDVTKRVRAEQDVGKERQRLRALLDTSPIGILVADVAGQVLQVNQEMQRVIGLTVEAGEQLGRLFDRVVLKRPDGSVYSFGELPLQRAINDQEQIWAEDVRIERPDGSVLPALVNATPIFSEDQQVASGVMVIQDISHIEEVSILRTEFLGMVSHELRNPLSIIKGAASTAVSSPVSLQPEDTFELFRMINEEADRMHHLVENLLDINRIESGSLPVTLEPQRFEAVLEEVRELFTRSSKPNPIAISIPSGLALVNMDRRKVLQVLMNILDNASKYSPPSSPISIEVIEESPAYIAVHVKDNGIGIAPDKLPLLFGKFSRLHTDTRHAASGIGLGLAICKGIVEAHGGRIWADSPGDGQGSTMSFTLPVSASVPAPLREVPQFESTRAGRPGKTATVLVVDEEQRITQILQRMLAEAGYRPVTSTDPSRVTQLVAAESPDLVLLGIRFSGTSGFEIFREIRKISGAPIVFLTTSDKEEDIRRASELGAAGYITKPFSSALLLARIEALLGN